MEILFVKWAYIEQSKPKAKTASIEIKITIMFEMNRSHSHTSMKLLDLFLTFLRSLTHCM